MAQIFLSHASSDKQLVRRLHDALAQAGHEPWIDDRLVVGESIPRAIADALEQADVVVLCLSEAARRSSWVDTERDVALMKQFSTGGVRVLPVRLANVPLPTMIRHFKYIDLFPAEQNFERGMASLLRAIDSPAAPEFAVAKTQQLPAPPPMRGLFVGREAELEQLRAMLTPGGRGSRRASLVGIRGIGGMGKTALAKVFAERYRDDFPGGILWADLGTNRDAGERGTNVNPEEVLRGTLLRWASEQGRAVTADTPRAALEGTVRSALAARAGAGGCLAILDNVDTALTLAPLLDVLSDCAVLITTRQQQLVDACGLEVIRLGGLDREASREYLRQVLQQSDGIEHLDPVLGYIEDHPLALKLLAEVLKAEPGLAVDDLMARLATAAPAAAGLDHIPAPLRSSFDLSFERMPAHLRPFLIALASQSPISWPLAAADYVSGVCQVERSRAMVAELCQLGFVEPAPGGRYRIHRLMRDYLRAAHGRDGVGFLRPTWEISSLARVLRTVSAGMAVYDLRQEFWFLRHARRNRDRPDILRAEWDGLLLGIARRMSRGALESAGQRFQDLKQFLRGADLSDLRVTRVLLDDADLDGARLERSDFSGQPLRRWPTARQIVRALPGILGFTLLTLAVVSAPLFLLSEKKITSWSDPFNLGALPPIALASASAVAWRTVLKGGLWFDRRGGRARLVFEQLTIAGVCLAVATPLLAWEDSGPPLVATVIGTYLVILRLLVREVVRWIETVGMGGLGRRMLAAVVSAVVTIAVGYLTISAATHHPRTAADDLGDVIVAAVLGGIVLVVSAYQTVVAFLRSPERTGLLSVRASYFRRARLTNANARNARFAWARLQLASLAGADLTGADFQHAKLTGADLTGARLVGADFRGADLERVALAGAIFDETTRWPEGFSPARTGHPASPGPTDHARQFAV